MIVCGRMSFGMRSQLKRLGAERRRAEIRTEKVTT